ncbi:DNA-binding GntR family transcriptional regulator [Azospirillum fermentarium]|uniref:GntR family transcriptional regulator n=1 Tax=Azospirillum fermentarium TaxID=1233114 RepID=UPI0022271511|nr:GntR family transcriptional regulator [Azospirillum fermentarium]MCW2248961.1 DNA-binding GntR family transcriptional regulator [Azospirillum fermentarium]
MLMTKQTMTVIGDPCSTGQWLEERILSGGIAPGARIVLDDIAEQRAVALSEVREAVLRLAGDGLVVVENGVVRAAPVSLADLKDLTATRVVVETEALRQSIACGGDSWRRQIHQSFERLAAVEPLAFDNPRDFLGEWEQCNAGFHAALVSACPLRRLMDVNRRLYKQHQRYRRLALLGGRGQRDVHAEHLGLYEAALSRDADGAARLLARHIGNTVDQLANGIRDGSWFGTPTGG